MASTFSRRLASRTVAASDPSLKEVLLRFPGVISFSGGVPDVGAFDMERIERVAQMAAQDRAAWQYTPTEGWKPLRERLAAKMQDLGLSVTWRNILVTNGSQHALDLLAKTFINPGDRVLIEQPGYLGAIQTMLSYEAQVVPVPMDGDGLMPDALSAASLSDAKLLYSVTTYCNPSGATLSDSRRRALMHLLNAHDGLMIEDATYQWLAYDGTPPPPVASLDTTGRVVFLGSFSKMLLPGVRVGWVVAPEDLIEQLSLIKQSADLATNSFGQVFVYTWLQEYGLQPPLAWYRSKRDRALLALHQHMPNTVTWNRPGGGFFIWITLPPEADARTILTAARQNGVSYVPGSAFGAEANTLRFSFSETPIEHIDEGVRRLAHTLRLAL